MGDVGNATVELNLAHLLWRTRGRHWDYIFLLQPKAPQLDGWYSVFDRIFESLTPGADERYVVGQLVVTGRSANEVTPFVATAFVDPARTDFGKRPITHSLVWFRPSVTLEQVAGAVPDHWGGQVLELLAPAFDAPDVFDAGVGSDSASAPGVADEALRAFTEHLAALPLQIAVTGETRPVTPTLVVDVKKTMVRQRAKN